MLSFKKSSTEKSTSTPKDSTEKGSSTPRDSTEESSSPPKDRLNIVYIIMLLHGVGLLLPWNMFINAKAYFVDYKLSYNYTGENNRYGSLFLPYIEISAQCPNLIMNWINIFIRTSGKLRTRMVWSIGIELICFSVTVVLAITDSSTWPGTFFWATICTVVVINMANGVYQNTIYGLAANLPPKYTGAIILGNNISGTCSSCVSIASIAIAPNAKTAIIYYFVCAFIILLFCFYTYFVLLSNQFYKYHELINYKRNSKVSTNSEGTQEEKIKNSDRVIPYFKIFKGAFPQCLNVYLVFVVTLAMFPAVDSDIKRYDENFIINDKYYVDVMCFLTFNFFAMVGSWLPSLVVWPGPKKLWIPITLRLVFIPLFLFCNYLPHNMTRNIPVLIPYDYAYWILGMLLGLTSGYFSSIAMMYCPRSVGAEHSTTAGMFGAACLITGICTGILLSMIFPWVVAST